MTTIDTGRLDRLEVLCREILAMCGRATGLETTYLTLIHRDAQVQEILFSRNVGSIEIPEGLRVDWSDTLCRRALEGEGPAYTTDVPGVYGDSTAARELGLHTYLSVPVAPAGGGPAFGTLCGASSQAVEVREDARDLMRSLATMVAMQLELEDASALLETTANTDALTAVANRRGLDVEIARIGALGDGTEVSVLVLDIDRFKAVNDTYGHLAGDDAIVHVARCLQDVARRGDVVGRLGGDEFVLLLVGVSVFGAVNVAERVAAAVASTPAATDAGPVDVRVSVGTATGAAREVLHLLAAADEALYEAKQRRP